MAELRLGRLVAVRMALFVTKCNRNEVQGRSIAGARPPVVPEVRPFRNSGIPTDDGDEESLSSGLRLASLAYLRKAGVSGRAHAAVQPTCRRHAADMSATKGDNNWCRPQTFSFCLLRQCENAQNGSGLLPSRLSCSSSRV